MKIDFKGLAEGIKNKFLPKESLKEAIENIYEQRIEICKGCEFYSKNNPKKEHQTPRCLNCGCLLALKARCLSCSCPINKWEALIDKDVEETMKKEINENS